MGSTTTSLLTLSLLLLLLPLSSATPASATLLDAVEILSSSGFQCMALHMELASQTLQPHHSLTIFAPTDAAFEGLPHHLSLSLLRYHLLPHAFSLHSLTSLPFGASIPTLLPNHSLTITTATPTTTTISINNVTLTPSPIFHHPNLTIFPTTTFFNPHFHLPPPHPPPKPNPPTTCPPSPHNPLSGAARLLRSHHFSIVASLLDLQFPSACNDRQLTLFAPLDDAVTDAGNSLTHLSSLLRHHLVPCKIAWRELAELRDGTLIGTYEKGFSLNVTKSKTHTLLLNGVQVVFPDMFRGDWLVVHGVQHVLSVHRGKRQHHAKHDKYRVSVAQDDDDDEDEVSSHSPEFDYENHHAKRNSAQHYRFSVFH